MIRVVRYVPDFVDDRNPRAQGTVATFEEAYELPFVSTWKDVKGFERFSHKDGETANGGRPTEILTAHFADGSYSVVAYMFPEETAS